MRAHLSEVAALSGLDYPGVGPELAHLLSQQRLEVMAVGDEEAMAACLSLARNEGILPALESSHALAALPTLCSQLDEDDVILVNLSGRGDKDLDVLVPRVAPG